MTDNNLSLFSMPPGISLTPANVVLHKEPATNVPEGWNIAATPGTDGFTVLSVERQDGGSLGDLDGVLRLKKAAEAVFGPSPLAVGAKDERGFRRVFIWYRSSGKPIAVNKTFKFGDYKLSLLNERESLFMPVSKIDGFTYLFIEGHFDAVADLSPVNRGGESDDDQAVMQAEFENLSAEVQEQPAKAATPKRECPQKDDEQSVRSTSAERVPYVVRLESDLKGHVSEMAKANGESMNSYIAKVLAATVEGMRSLESGPFGDLTNPSAIHASLTMRLQEIKTVMEALDSAGWRTSGAEDHKGFEVAMAEAASSLRKALSCLGARDTRTS